MTFSTPSKASTEEGKTQRSKSERKPSGTRSVAALLEKSSVLTSALAAARKDNSGDSHHTPSRLQELSSAEPAQGSQTAPRPLGSGARAQDLAEEEDLFEFSKDVTSLSEILQGSGISEKRLAPEAAMMRKSSVHEFRQLREKRASIFKGAIRVVKTNFKTPAGASSTAGSARLQNACSRPEPSAHTRSAQSAASVARPASATSAHPASVHQPASARADANGSAACGPGALAGASAAGAGAPTPSRTRSESASKAAVTPRGLHTGTSGMGAKAAMTPANARAKGLAGAIGSLLKDRAAAAATPSRAPGSAAKMAMLAAPTPPPECLSTQERAALAEHTEGHATQTLNVAKMLDMNQGSVAGDSRSARDTTAAAVISAALPAAADAQDAAASSSLPAASSSAAAATKQASVAKLYRSRKSELLAEARRRVGVKSPRKKLVQGTLTSASTLPADAAGEDSISCAALMSPLLLAAHAPASQVQTPSPGKLQVRVTKGMHTRILCRGGWS